MDLQKYIEMDKKRIKLQNKWYLYYSKVVMLFIIACAIYTQFAVLNVISDESKRIMSITEIVINADVIFAFTWFEGIESTSGYGKNTICKIFRYIPFDEKLFYKSRKNFFLKKLIIITVVYEVLLAVTYFLTNRTLLSVNYISPLIGVVIAYLFYNIIIYYEKKDLL